MCCRPPPVQPRRGFPTNLSHLLSRECPWQIAYTLPAYDFEISQLAHLDQLQNNQKAESRRSSAVPALGPTRHHPFVRDPLPRARDKIKVTPASAIHISIYASRFPLHPRVPREKGDIASRARWTSAFETRVPPLGESEPTIHLPGWKLQGSRKPSLSCWTT